MHQPLRSNTQLTQNQSMTLPKNRNALSSPRNNRRRQRRNDMNATRDDSLPSPRSKRMSSKPKLQQEDSASSPRNSPRNNHSSLQNSFMEGGPTDNDVVCFTFFCPERPQGVIIIQPESTKHKGNLLYCELVRRRAQSYQRAMYVASRSHPSRPGHVPEKSQRKAQKRLAKSIVTEVQSRGGNFLVWIKENKNLTEHTNNGSWQVIDEEDAQKISRYSLLQQAEAMEKSSANRRKAKSPPERKAHSPAPPENPISPPEKKTPISVPPGFSLPPGIPIPPHLFKAAYESDDSTTTSATSIDTLQQILSVISEDGDDDSLDIWPVSSGISTETENRHRKGSPRLNAGCWEYRLFLPSAKG